MNPKPDPVFVAYDGFRRWFSDRGKDLFFATLQCLIGGGLTYSIIVSSWRAGSFPPKQPDGIDDVIAATIILAWSVAALVAAIGIMFRARWAWMIQIFVMTALFVVQVYVVSQIAWRELASFEDWFRAIQAVVLTIGFGSFAVYAFRKAFPKNESNNPGVHSASHESATTNTR